MKKLLVIIGILILIFLFKDQLNPYWIEFYPSFKKDEPMTWVMTEGEELYRDLPEMDFDTAILSLKNFETKVTGNLQKLGEMGLEEEQRRTYRRKLICELAVVYKKLAMFHMSKGNDDLYIKYIQKSRDKLAECADLNND